MGEITNNTKSLRINIPVNRKEYRTVLKAAKVMCVKPAEFGREAIKRAARQVLKRAGISVRLDMDDYMKEGPEAEEAGDAENRGGSSGWAPKDGEIASPATRGLRAVEADAPSAAAQFKSERPDHSPPARYDPTPIAPEAPVEPDDDWEGEA